ncbi:GNAT family N-acetyltransferase [Paludibaculum fermentans]|uniref:GNAT family N-acetyltransferase n=1 Tax=Paludibaculum fermentans TaxID=1473598 RepID=A0A7S7NWW5_PALFE|nr:GNAT family N-acetyltransferase [Paludibaculum fermentans]QOY91260.1 GNAT family N-acetyltransferase [Paludibaculum fermentans]
MPGGADSITIRRLLPGDIPTGLRLCRASRWNQVERDWAHFLQLSPQGCLGAQVDDRIVGTVATVRYEPDMAWIGMVLVDPSARGRGIGTVLLNESLELLRDVPSVWLDATAAGYGLYKNRGFEEDSRLVRMECLAPPLSAIDQALLPLTSPGAIGELDRSIFGAARRFHLAWLIEGCPECAWTLPGNSGYVMARHGEHFLQIGPVVAPDPPAAELLVKAALRHAQGRPVVIDATLHDPAWRQRLEALGFLEQRDFVRMRKGPAGSKLPHPWEYAIVGPEFG